MIWDPRKCRLVAARDPFGQEPLFSYEGTEVVAVASGLNVLRGLPPVSDEIDERRVADFLMFMHQDKEATFYKDIRRVPPSHLLVASRSDTELRQYRTLSPSGGGGCQSDSEYEETYRERLFRAVRRSTRGSGRIGTWLSGGLDSSSITCAARGLLPEKEPISTFSLTFDTVPQSDEQEFIEAVLRAGEYDAHFVPGDKEGPLDVADEAMRVLGEPFTTPNLFMTVSLLQAAEQSGVDTALDGFLGDSVTGHGTTRLTELAVTGQWLTAARELQAVAQMLGPSLKTYQNLFRTYISGPLVAEPLRRAWKELRGKPVGDEDTRNVVQPGLLRSTNWEQRARAHGAVRTQSPVREEEAHRKEFQSGNLRLAVETAIRMGREFGVSVRFPFADEDLISFCLALPPQQKCRGGWTRRIAREALSGVLPEKIAGRHGKTSLGPVFNRALFDLNGEKLRAIVHDQLERASAFLRPDVVRRLYQRSVDGEASQDEIAILWNAVLLARWMNLRATADKASPTPSASLTHTQPT